MPVTLKWFGHASFQVSGGGKTVFIDPWKLPDGAGPADVVVVSHSHYDHCSPDDVAKVRKDDTVVLAPADCVEKISGDVTVVAPGQNYIIEDRKIDIGPGHPDRAVASMVSVVPAYNIGKEFHPKANGWFGVVVKLGGASVYYAGDTDLIPEMGDLRGISLALLPVGGTYTMDADQAAEAVKAIKPAMAIPYHWGDIVGDHGDADRFKAAAERPVTILTPGTETTLAGPPDGKTPSDS